MSANKCKCTVASLLKLSIEMIDLPPRNDDRSKKETSYTEANFFKEPNDEGTSTEEVTRHQPMFEQSCATDSSSLPTKLKGISYTKRKGLDSSTDSEEKIEFSCPPLTEVKRCSSKKIKKVRFDESIPKKKEISAQDVIIAYDLLIHAARISCSAFNDKRNSNIKDLSSKNEDQQEGENFAAILINSDCITNFYSALSWKIIQQNADLYRLLLITCCLLLELLPQPSSPSIITESKYQQANIRFSLANQHEPCPYASSTSLSIPTLTSSIMKQILSTSRRCILLLQSLEKICTVKSISESVNFNQYSTSGDDIADYDRCINDLYINYDWHDDGFLPLPFSYSSDDLDEYEKSEQSFYKSHICKGKQEKVSILENKNKQQSIIFECCYRPHHSSDPPSSKFEKSAWTRSWIQEERLISLSLEDYQYDNACNSYLTNNCSSEVHQELTHSIDTYKNSCLIVEGRNMEEENIEISFISQLHPNAVLKTSGMSQDICADKSFEEIDLLNLSPSALVEAERSLLDIMIPTGVHDSHHSTSCDYHPQNNCWSVYTRKSSGSKKRQKKRMGHCQQIQAQLDTYHSAQPNIYMKEGFLLLLKENDCRANCQQMFHSSRRVFVRLHPSGWLSIENRSVRLKEYDNKCKEDVISSPQTPYSLARRLHNLDSFIGSSTVSQPCIPDGTNTFHFCVKNIHILRLSSVGNCQDTKETAAYFLDGNCDLKINKKYNFLFAIDEATGGTIMDGFEWVRALSGTSFNLDTLNKTLRSEWTENVC